MDKLEHAIKHSEKLKRQREGLVPTGFVYIIQCHDFVKVGFADNVSTKLSNLQSGCPYELRLLASWKVEAAAIAESKLHRLWERYEIRGEWFKVPYGELVCVINAKSFDDVFK
jgi:hypothetical protein